MQKRGWVKHVAGLLKVEPAKDQAGERIIEKHGVKFLATITEEAPEQPQGTPGQTGEIKGSRSRGQSR